MSSILFEKELQSMISQFALYEVQSNQAAALAVIPSDFLMAIAQAKCDSSSQDITNSSSNSLNNQNLVRDMYLLELMSWFKNDFFRWMDSPNCPTCSRPTTAIGHGRPTPEELAESASRVEIFTCSHCFQDKREVARFPRYNHPLILLKTRTGRCGEWANCFALICRASGFEIRHIRDWTDHVWLEIWSSSLTPPRWAHVDPCENSYDSPLLYEKGWGKKLSYVIGVSQDDIHDVTWRYVQEENVKGVLARRNLIEESRLVQVILSLKRRLQANLSSQSRKDTLRTRLIEEMVELLYPRKVQAMGGIKDSELEGRESGSLAWRLARQELGGSSSGETNRLESGFIWKITRENIFQGSKYLMTYDSVKDQYSVGTNSIETKAGWKAGARSVENLFQKKEHDWKMVYLARNEHSSANASGIISWKFDLPDPTLEIKSAKIQVAGAIFHSSASIMVTLTDDKKGHVYKLVDTNNNKVDGLLSWNSDGAFQACHCITLTCKLQGGEGNTGWQHAQLFRQKLDSSCSTFSLKVELDVGVTKI